MKVVMASNNAHKIAELRAILSAYGLDVVSQREAGVHVEPEETGTTFEENSRIKAVAVMQACGPPRARRPASAACPPWRTTPA